MTIPTMKLLPALSLVLLMAACAPTGPDRRPDPGTTDPADLAAQGRHAEAAQAWLQRAELEPGPGVAARLSAARQWLRAGKPGQARSVINELRRAELTRTQTFELDLLRAELALEERDFTTASRLLAAEMPGLPERLSQRFERLSTRLQQNNPDSAQARVRELDRALEEADFEPQFALALLLELALPTLRDLRREHAAETRLAPWLDLAVAARSHVLDDGELGQALEAWQQQYPSEAVSVPALVEWIQAWRETQPMPSRVAVLLPGEGPLVAAGDMLRQGLLAAWLALDPERRPKLDFYYLSEQPDAAVGARFEAREAGSDWIIGPLDRNQIAPLLNTPDAGIPTLLLNRPADPAQMPRPVQPIAMLALPPEEEAELAAVRALVQQHQRSLVIAQDSDFGARVADRFIDTFELGGGTVLDRADYSPQNFDHTDQLELLLEIDRSRERIARLEAVLGEDVESEPQRRTDAEVVFLATRGGDARQLIPQLKFLDLEELPMFATSHVYSRADAGPDLDGVQFPISPWLLEDGPAAEVRQRAERQFPALESSITLSQLHALGRDALALLPWLDMMKRDRLLYLDGYVGRLRLADGVVLERDLPWARIEAGHPVRHDPES